MLASQSGTRYFYLTVLRGRQEFRSSCLKSLTNRKGLNLLRYSTGYFLASIKVREAEGEGSYVATTCAAHAATT